MCRHPALLGAILILLMGLAPMAQTTVTVTGTAAILNKDATQARDRAIENALRTAVERVVGTMVDSDSLVKDNDLLSDKIYTQTTGYISNYKILSESSDTDSNIYSVKVEASVKEGNLSNDLKSLGVLMHRMDMPRVAVALQEQDETASDQLLRMLKNKGFLVVDTGQKSQSQGFWDMNQGQQADLMKRYGAEVVILGTAKGEGGSSIGGSSLKSYQANVSLKALKTDSHEVLGTSTGSGTAVHVGEAGLTQATRQAITVAGNDILRQITSQWAKETSSTRIIALEVLSADASKAGNIAKKLKQQGRGIQDAIVREAEGGRATLNVSMQGDASALAQEIRKIYPGARIVSQSANRLTVSF